MPGSYSALPLIIHASHVFCTFEQKHKNYVFCIANTFLYFITCIDIGLAVVSRLDFKCMLTFLFLYGPFFHGALILDMSTLFTTFYF